MNTHLSPALQTPLEHEIATHLVEALQLEMTSEEIDPQAPLFGEGLGLDSIDALEISLIASRHYGVQLRSDDEHNREIFHSLRSLSAYIAAHRQAA
ncbi:phosphopantetheine-binding protein [Kozakia baliensis]|uniref:Acyl carrier protein n=1 Tax=Kozakia baliensis TaxID=153496 RepID=A0A1D8UR59_9PROT|nr:phosphopantetheine-binding protein [Kozakia baliensis]AOX16133.1 acyl carrier protein [Kozakia baliensis]AOX19092.1 acyl carrier protein [Kozakia baliensis]